jgi:spermidine synthase
VAVYGATVLLSAFLLFQVQLLLGKHILPWFGGVPAVWTTCMLFFQVVLLGGYAYAHGVAHRLSPRAQRRMHLAVLALALAALAALAVAWGSPVLPGVAWKPLTERAPVWQIVRLLAVAIGLPFFVLSATGPLIQAWFAVQHPTRSPYRLYALSNLGSLLGLLTYPFAVEVWLPLRTQAWVWAAGFVLFAAGMSACAPGAPARAAAAASPQGDDPSPMATQRVLWFALGGCASVMLLATTNQMSQEIAVVPFLWMLPLCLYLLSFILCFDSERWYSRGVFGTLLVLGLVLSAFVMERSVFARISLQIVVPALTLFAACMICHGELVRLRPAPRHLTGFYLTLTASGAAGGLFVGVVAPAVFPGLWEYPIALWASAALLAVVLWRDRTVPLRAATLWPVGAAFVAAVLVTTYLLRDWLVPTLPELPDRCLFGAPPGIAAVTLAAHHLGRRRWSVGGETVARSSWPRRALMGGAVAGARVLLAVVLVVLTRRPLADAVYQARNFYGVLQVIDEDADEPEMHLIKLRHGRIIHGVQYQAEDRRHVPTTYYGADSGIALALENHPRRAEGLRIGVIGLGTGSLAVWARPADAIRFYEINPDVLRIAGPDATTFTYLHDSPAHVEVTLGDARLALEQELARGAPQRFDVLAMDAFSSDAIPMHLLTREAIAVYLQHLSPSGILAVHVSNRYLDLEPVVRGIARHFGLAHVFVSAAEGELTWSNTWALLTRDRRLLEIDAITEVADTRDDDAPATLWTDDYSNLLGVLRL